MRIDQQLFDDQMKMHVLGILNYMAHESYPINVNSPSFLNDGSPNQIFWNKEGSLNWTNTNLMVQQYLPFVCTGISVYEKGRRRTKALFHPLMRSQRGYTRLGLEHIQLDDRAWTALQSLDDMLLHVTRKSQGWDKILLVPPYLGFPLLLMWLKISLSLCSMESFHWYFTK